MVSRRSVIAVTAIALAVGGTFLWLFPEARIAVATAVRSVQGTASPKTVKHGHANDPHERHGPEGLVKLSAEQIARAKIELAPAAKGTLVRRVTVPGIVIPDADRIGRVAAKVIGTVAEMRKRLGDPVAKGEVVAVLSSREVADAKSDYLTALVHFDLQKTLHEREQALWDKKITSEQQYLRARSVFIEAQLRVNVARQKLAALDLSDAEVASLSTDQVAGLRHKEIRAPLAGQIVERRVDLGAPVGREGQESELYVIADLAFVWVEVSVPSADLISIKVGQPVIVGTGPDASRAEGKIVFISPLLNAETRSARVIVGIDNKDLTWRPAAFVTAQIVVDEQEAELVVPRAAVQTIGGEQILFVRTEEGFEKREVVLGRSDDTNIEVVFGLDAGETIAVTNTFILKAQLGKSEADHGHVH